MPGKLAQQEGGRHARFHQGRGHTDRDACEYSASITLKREPKDAIWLLYLESDKTYGVELEAGDALIYKGIESPHWREKFEGERLAQVFLHYVRR